MSRTSDADKVRAIQLARQGISLDEIAKTFHVSYDTIHRWLKTVEKTAITTADIANIIQLSYIGLDRYAIAQHTGIKLEQVDAVRTRLIVLEYISGRSVKDLYAAYHIYLPNINQMLQEFGVNQLEHMAMTTFLDRLSEENGYFKSYRPISKFLNEMLVGNLLGDGSLRLSTKEAREKYYVFPAQPTFEQYTEASNFFQYMRTLTKLPLPSDDEIKRLVAKYNAASRVIPNYPLGFFEIQKSILELRYIEFGMAKKLRDNKYPFSLGVYLVKHSSPNDNGVYRLMVRLTTYVTAQLALMYKHWYPRERKKVLPREGFDLTANTLFAWYVDDGSYSKSTKSYDRITNMYRRGQIEFSTQSFTESENNLLVHKINNLLYTNANKDRHSDHWRIRCGGSEDIKRIIEYMARNTDKELFQIAAHEFPYKFDARIQKKDIFEQKRNANDPLMALYDIAVQPEKIHDIQILKTIIALLKKAGSHLMVHEPNVNL